MIPQGVLKVKLNLGIRVANPLFSKKGLVGSRLPMRGDAPRPPELGCLRHTTAQVPMFDADTGCIATDPAPSARRRFRSKTGIENLPANEHAQETPHTPSPTRTTRRIQSGCAGSRPRLRDGMPGSPSQHIDITRAKWIPYFG